MKTRHEVGMIKNIKYVLVFDKRGHQQLCDDEYYNEWRWFLTVEDEYRGDFRTKKEAFSYFI